MKKKVGVNERCAKEIIFQSNGIVKIEVPIVTKDGVKHVITFACLNVRGEMWVGNGVDENLCEGEIEPKSLQNIYKAIMYNNKH